MEFELVLVRAIRELWLPVLVGAAAVLCVAALLAYAHLRARGLLDLYTQVCALCSRHERRRDEPLSALKLAKYRKLESHLRELLKKEGLRFAPPPAPAAPAPSSPRR